MFIWLIIALSILVALFFFWRDLKEDYLSEHIFNTAFIFVFSSILLILLFFLFFHHLLLALFFIACCISFFYLRKQKIKPNHFFDALIRALIIFQLPLFAFFAFTYHKWQDLLYFCFLLILIPIVLFISQKWISFFSKQIKSGSKGLLFISFLFLFRGLLALADFSPSFSLGRDWEMMQAGIVALISLLVLYNKNR